MAKCREKAVLFAFGSCCSYFMPSKFYVPFPFGVQGRNFNLIASVPDCCLSVYFTVGSGKDEL